MMDAAQERLREQIIAGFNALRSDFPWLLHVQHQRQGAVAIYTLEGEQRSEGLPSLRFCVVATGTLTANGAPTAPLAATVRWALQTPSTDVYTVADTAPRAAMVELVPSSEHLGDVAIGLSEHQLTRAVANVLQVANRECGFFTAMEPHRGGGHWTLRGLHCGIQIRIVVAYDRVDTLDPQTSPAALARAARNAPDWDSLPRWQLLAADDIDLLWRQPVVGLGDQVEPLFYRLHAHLKAFRETDSAALIIADLFDHVAYGCRYDQGTWEQPVPCTCPVGIQQRRAAAYAAAAAASGDDDTMVL
jgi:hypothetical protein